MYANSKSCVRSGIHITSTFPVKLRVKQEDNMRPNLFKICLNDLPNYLKSTPDSGDHL